MNPRLAILRACKRLITPWARYLLHQGISYREFDDVVRGVFVDIATSEFGIRGRPTNASRVAVLTGLTRKQIKKIREAIEDVPVEETASNNQATDVLSAWYSEANYVDESRRPRPIPFDGAEISFSELVRKHGRDIPPRAMLRELKRTKAVEERDDGMLEAKSRFNVYSGSKHIASIDRSGEAIRQFLSSIVFNMMRDEDVTGRYERRSLAPGLTDSQKKRYEEIVRAKADSLLEELEEWFVQERTGAEASDAPMIGCGVYLFSDSPKKRL